MAMVAIRPVFLLALLLLASPPALVVRCESEGDADIPEIVENSDLGIVGDDIQDFGEASLSPAPGADTVCLFPKNPGKFVPAGKEGELLVGITNKGESALNVRAIRASIHLPLHHEYLVQNLTLQEFYNASVPISAQATFPYMFSVSKFLQPGSFDLVGTIFYEIDEHPYQTVFYNGTIEVVETGSFLSMESVFLAMLGLALLGLLGVWIYGQFQQLTKKTKKAPKVEVGTGTTDASIDEWLQGTAYTQTQSKSKKNNKPSHGLATLANGLLQVHYCLICLIFQAGAINLNSEVVEAAFNFIMTVGKN